MSDNMELGMTLDIDIEDFEKFITSTKFTDFLLANTTEFATAAFILQTLLEKLNEIKGD